MRKYFRAVLGKKQGPEPQAGGCLVNVIADKQKMQPRHRLPSRAVMSRGADMSRLSARGRRESMEETSLHRLKLTAERPHPHRVTDSCRRRRGKRYYEDQMRHLESEDTRGRKLSRLFLLNRRRWYGRFL